MGIEITKDLLKKIYTNYEEHKDKIPKKEVINRLSPIDLPSYQKVELENINEIILTNVSSFE